MAWRVSRMMIGRLEGPSAGFTDTLILIMVLHSRKKESFRVVTPDRRGLLSLCTWTDDWGRSIEQILLILGNYYIFLIYMANIVHTKNPTREGFVEFVPAEAKSINSGSLEVLRICWYRDIPRNSGVKEGKHCYSPVLKMLASWSIYCPSLRSHKKITLVMRS